MPAPQVAGWAEQGKGAPDCAACPAGTRVSCGDDGTLFLRPLVGGGFSGRKSGIPLHPRGWSNAHPAWDKGDKRVRQFHVATQESTFFKQLFGDQLVGQGVRLKSVQRGMRTGKDDRTMSVHLTSESGYLFIKLTSRHGACPYYCASVLGDDVFVALGGAVKPQSEVRMNAVGLRLQKTDPQPSQVCPNPSRG